MGCTNSTFSASIIPHVKEDEFACAGTLSDKSSKTSISPKRRSRRSTGDSTMSTSSQASESDLLVSGIFVIIAKYEGEKSVEKLRQYLNERNANGLEERILNCVTPLQWAVAFNRMEAVHLLVSCGASLEDHNILMNTPLHIAIEHGFDDLALALVSIGADIYARNSKGDTCISAAPKLLRNKMLQLAKMNGTTGLDLVQVHLSRGNSLSPTPQDWKTFWNH